MTDCADFLLADWLFFLENRHKQEIQLGLPRVKEVAARLNLMTLDARVITVGGTNGKGSTVAALEAIYLAAGYQVASYTSPHLLSFNERIRINSQPITDEELCAAFFVIEQARADTCLTYFEMTTLAALWYFKQTALDVVIIEVGLGGRHDATNIIDSDLAIITTVDLDHQDLLGDTVDEIGYQKAGILRANCPFIYADSNPPASVIEQAQALNTKMHCLDTNYFFKASGDSLHVFNQSETMVSLPLPTINLKAAVAAIMASHCLHSVLPVTDSHWREAMQTVSILGRQQVIEGDITTIFDVAHNPQAVSSLAGFMEQYQAKGSVHAVFSALKDKDLCGLIKPMSPFVDFWYPGLLTGKRATSESQLNASFVEAINVIPACYKNPLMAYQMAHQQAKSGDVVLVYGSFLMVAAVMAAMNQGVV